ncbi:hypothetical protein AV521_00555 [Streptomyces sp. IMTB 2501]|uniref:hypothetical protein n=1 Tax=Streptomyces sp. IMTB 2501 TaxID=1776340 RepID=UPI00096FB71D|nr:hypothetical protein [Streptomyces sp. IMTB 2501]OLZ74223.1 hypothetical protein AV521_00555 [Streptomyces sp. IMTB 2501]
MKTYQIEYFQTATYRFEVQAENEDVAEDAAGEFWRTLPASKEHEYLYDVDDSFIDRLTVKADV